MEIKKIKDNTVKTKISNITYNNQEEFNQVFIDDLIKLKSFITVAPTFIPKKFIEQIQFFYDGTDYKVYFYINNNWKSIILT